tara:strand:+ start:3917 stop:4510 length:594 start_codon:yes stop_codon:yes gene_type:complete
MNNFKQYQNELKEKYKKSELNKKSDIIPPIIKPKRKLVQDIIVIDSNTRNKDDYLLPNEFVITLSEILKQVIAVRLIRTEYLINEPSFTTALINNQPVPLQLFKHIQAYIYLNGYEKIKLANKMTIPIFSQLSAGVETLPPSNDNIKFDPYAYILNPRNEKLDKFHIKILDSQGDKIPIIDPDKIRLIITLAIYRCV